MTVLQSNRPNWLKNLFISFLFSPLFLSLHQPHSVSCCTTWSLAALFSAKKIKLRAGRSSLSEVNARWHGMYDDYKQNTNHTHTFRYREKCVISCEESSCTKRESEKRRGIKLGGRYINMDCWGKKMQRVMPHFVICADVTDDDEKKKTEKQKWKLKERLGGFETHNSMCAH